MFKIFSYNMINYLGGINDYLDIFDDEEWDNAIDIVTIILD
jgi:hypothetical protein